MWGERGCRLTEVTEAWWGHSGLGNDSEDTEIAVCLDIVSIVSLPPLLKILFDI